VLFEDYIGALEGDEEILRWKSYLEQRYLIRDS